MVILERTKTYSECALTPREFAAAIEAGTRVPLRVLESRQLRPVFLAEKRAFLVRLLAGLWRESEAV